MKKSVISLVAAVMALIMLAGCSAGQSAGVYTDDNKIPYENMPGDLEGAASVEREGDVKASSYYLCPDFYNMKSNETLTILENFKTIQQATEWTCGPTSALMVIEYYGKREGRNEFDLVALRQKDEPGATNLRQMLNIFDGLGGYEYTSTYDIDVEEGIAEDYILNTLKEGTPILLGWDEWGGHWQVIIGYDTMGTDTTADDVLIICDPYDTTDHNQDGYVIESFERVYYNWKNTFDPDFKQYVFAAVKPAK